ncbi:RidA family protein [Pendulispora albinea]|uniref:RidA family protein n=1 Tax=Pendulispora albinea TaxID=2741071 RepID=A0ABZ2MBX6_9BACT
MKSNFVCTLLGGVAGIFGIVAGCAGEATGETGTSASDTRLVTSQDVDGLAHRHKTRIERIVTHPDPYEPFHLAQGYRVGDMLYISGQAGYDDRGKIVEGGFGAQADRAMSNLRRALEAGGSSMKNVMKVTIFLTDMGHFQDIVALREKWFVAPYPADTIVEIRALYTPEAKIEIEAIAVADDAAERR